MSIIKSFSVGNGDMFYIKHNTENFTVIDCCLDDDNKKRICEEINSLSKNCITRFISTHPDEDHISGIEYFDNLVGIVNFYCVKNNAIKKVETDSFKKYCSLRDESYFIKKGIKRKWLNDHDDERGSSGIHFLWPNVENEAFKDALQKVNKGEGFNNISPIFTYSLENGVTAIWFGDLETDFLEKIEEEIDWAELGDRIDIVFVPHHGRESGKIPHSILEKLKPQVIIIGEAPSEYLDYYKGYNTITQNSAKDIILDCRRGYIDIFVSNENYKPTFSISRNQESDHANLDHYLGTIDTKKKA